MDNLSSTKRYAIVFAKYMAALVILGLVVRQVGAQNLWGEFQRIELTWLLLAFLLLNLSQILSGFRMQFYFRTRRLTLRYPFALALYYVGMFYNTLLPGGVGGDGYKVYYLKKHADFPSLEAVRIMLAERANGLLALLLIVYALLPFTPILEQYESASIWLLVAVVVTLAGYFSAGRKVTGEKISDSLKALLLSFGIQLTILGSAITLFFGMGMGSQWVSYSLLFMLSAIASIMPISVGGVGIREFIFFAAEPYTHTSGSAGVAFAMVWFGVYLLSSLFGLCVQPTLRKMEIQALPLRD